MSRRLLAPALATVALSLFGALLLGCGGGDGPGAAQASGATLYGEYCALCHGAQGEGGAAPGATALANQDLLVAASYDFLFETIADGRPGTTMSAWGERHEGPLSDAEVAILVRFIEEWRTEPAVVVDDRTVTGSAAQGAEIYEMQCASCHGMDGSGGTAPSLGNPRFLAAASDGFIRYAIANGRRGTAMPAYEGDLTEQQIDDVTAFVRSWQGG